MRTLRADQRSQQTQNTAQPDKAPFSDGSGFTPGPWVARPDPRENGEWEVIKPDDDKDFADEPWFIAGCFDDADGASAEANARLIAAAPEMFKALDEVAAAFSEGVAWTEDQRKAYESVRVALSKALSRSARHG